MAFHEAFQEKPKRIVTEIPDRKQSSFCSLTMLTISALNVTLLNPVSGIVAPPVTLTRICALVHVRADGLKAPWFHRHAGRSL